MKYFATAAAILSVAPSVFSLTINTPTSVVQCQPQLITWADGTAPYYLTVIPGGQPSAPALKSFDTTSSTSNTWLVDIPSGTRITMALKDSTGATAYTDIVNIQPSNDSSCLNGGSSSGSTPGNDGNAGPSVATQAAEATSAASASASASPGSSSARPGTTSSGRVTSVSPATQTVSRPAGTAAVSGTSATTNTSGAESRFSAGGFGFVGVLSLVGAMLL